ncbi:MAG: CotH kinase family protein [Polyangiaceae bacterium]|nr:CotH kinase family protein [Polyangiaceae bacterium]
MVPPASGSAAGSGMVTGRGASISATGGGTPTLGSGGGTGGIGVVSEPALQLSATRGFYDAPFDLVVSHPSALQVAYTLDSSDPRSSSSAITAGLPLTVHIDPADTTDRYLAPGVVFRAVPLDVVPAPPQSVSTHTYLFLGRVMDLSPDGESPGGGWPAERAPGVGDDGPQVIDFGMDPNVCEASAYSAQIVPALRALPSISLVSDLSNLFDEEHGIYVHADESGQEWERPGSVELLNPDGAQGFQSNTGIRIRGGYSRHPNNPKHAFRLFFRGEYGNGKLSYPLFGAEGVSDFDKIDLRTAQNYSWSFWGDSLNTFLRDVFSRDLQRELGRPYTRSRYYHLYLDGYYWGLFQTQERSEARYAESYFGGDRDDYDVVKVDYAAGRVIEATDGDLESWRAIWDRCASGFAADADYYALEGKGPDGQRDPNLKVLVDVDNLIDYMLVIFYTGNFDGPVSSFFDNKDPNNFYAINHRLNPEQGFVFFAHDNEHTLMPDEVRMNGLVGLGLEENRVNIGSVNHGPGLMTVDSFEKLHPQWLHHRLTENASYRERFAARAPQLLSGSGPMTPTAAARLIHARRQEIDLAIIAESARWGDAQGEPPRTKDRDWTPAVEAILKDYLPHRTQIVVDQLREQGLYP